jgi:hypothetical protein
MHCVYFILKIRVLSGLCFEVISYIATKEREYNNNNNNN